MFSKMLAKGRSGSMAITRVGNMALALAAASALFPTLLLLSMFLPSIAFVGARPSTPVLYGLLGGWLLCAVVRGALARRFTALERQVVTFWSHTLLFVLLFSTVIGAIPIFLLPAMSRSAGWSSFQSPLYIRSAAVVVLLCSVLAVWSLWRSHWEALVHSPEDR